MTANEQPDGILLDLIRYAINVATVVGSLALIGVLLFVLVARANPESAQPAGEGQIAQAPAAPTATEAPTAAEEPEEPSAPSAELLATGEEIFISQGCGACHLIEGVAQGVVGPELNDIGVVAEERAQEAGVTDAEAYVQQSIVAPNEYIVAECPTGACTPGVMPANFGDALSDEELNALVQYLLAQQGGG